MILKKTDLLRLLPIRPAVLHVADVTYAVPTSRWIRQDFYPWFHFTRRSLGLGYNRRHDCDNFALAVASAAADCHALTTALKGQSLDADAVAVGEFWYVTEAGGAHAINVAIVDNGELFFFEPQDGKHLTLTDKEIQSCSFVRF